MNKFIRHLLLFLAALLIILLVVRLVQSHFQRQAAYQQQLYDYQLQQDRERADGLYQRLLELKSLRDDLVVPQMEISIKI